MLLSATPHLAGNLDALAGCQSLAVERLMAEPARMRVERASPVSVLFACRANTSIALNSRRDPVAEAQRWLDDTLPPGADPETVIVIGAGLGYVLDVLERRCPAARVIVVEPLGESARALLEHRDWSGRIRDGRLRLLVGPDFAGSDRLLWMLEDSRPPVLLEHPVLAREWPDEMAAARRAAAGLVYAAGANRTARRDNAGRYLINTLRNIPALARESDVDRLANVFPGRPCLLVSAGPSLDRSIAEIGRRRGRAVIISVDTALRPLLTAGIVPHLVVCLDPSRLNAEHLLDLPDISGVALAAEGSVNPIALDAFRDRTFFFRVGAEHPWPWLVDAGCDRGVLPVWGSVATAALSLARRLGCDPVVFCGQDLAYTDGRAYCTGTTWDLMGIAAGKRAEIPTRDLHGRPSATAPHLVSFRDWLVDQSLTDTARRYVNTSDDGILYGGRIELLSLERALAGSDTLDDRHVRAVIRSAHVVPPSERLMERARLLAASIDPAAACGEPLASWMAFAGPPVRAAVIVDALAGRVSGSAAAGDAGTTAEAPACDRIAAECDRLDPRRHHRPGTLTHQDLARMEAIIRECRPGRARLINPDIVTTLLVASCVPESAKVHLTTAAGAAPAGTGAADLVVLRLAPGDEDAGAIVEAACVHLQPGGLLLIVDALDRVVGTSLRRVIDRHLAANPDYTLIGRRMYDWFSRVVLVRRDDSAAARPGPAPGHPVGVPIGSSDAALLASLIVRRLRPSSVAVPLAATALWTHAFSAWPGIRIAAATPGSAERCDVALGLDALALADPVAEGDLISRLCGLSDAIVLTIPTPGWELTPDQNPRPLTYWAERFLEQGYVLSDDLRPLLEDRRDFGERLYDLSLLYVARRVESPDARAALMASPELRSLIAGGLTRIEDLFLQSALLRLDRRTAQPHTDLASRERSARLPLDIAEIDHTAGHGYVVRFSQPGVRQCLRSGLLRNATLEEDGCTLPRAHARVVDVEAEGRGRYYVRSDGVFFSASDNSDPRTNGRTYALRVPAPVAGLARSGNES